MSKSYYYLNEAREVLGPVSEATLKELHKVGALDENPQICEKGTEAWLRFADAFPDAVPSPEPASTSPDSAVAGSARSSEAATTPPPTPAAKASPPVVEAAQAPASGTGSKSYLKPVLIGCGALALLGVVGMIGLAAMMAAAGGGAGGGDFSSSGASSSAPSYGGGYQQQHAKSPCRRCGGGGQLMDRCTQCNGNGTIMTGVDSSLDPDPTRSWNRNPPMQVPCPRCRGGGHMPIPCTQCRGTGVN